MGRDRGKEEKFEELYQQYRNAVYRISLHYTKNEQEAQDITQKTFFAFYLRMDKIKWECAREYLFRTAKNLSYNWLRDTKREREGKCEEYVFESSCIEKSAEETYLTHQDEREKKELFAELMRELYIVNNEWYEIVDSIYCLQMSHHDTAELLRISKTNLYSKLYRARKWMEKRYKEKNKER